ncbi:MAG: ATP/GTP-binding protein [Butyrivibrio sp.]|nr:ATP/GTP-binding protein [Butyrivibrio sp.]
MLIRFNVKNFRSFGTREDGKSEEFSMIAGKVRRDTEHIHEDKNIRLLKFAAVFGANASGKSNLVKAMEFMQSTVIMGIQNKYMDSYCKTEERNREKTSYFEMEMLLDGKCYAYGFEILLSQSRFVSEWLFETSQNSDDLVFSRDIEKGEWQVGNQYQRGDLGNRIKVYISDIAKDSTALFLTVMNRNKQTLYDEFSEAAVFLKVYHWIERNLSVSFPNQQLTDNKIYMNNENIKDVCELLQEFGTGITNYEHVEIDYEKILSSLDIVTRTQLGNMIESTKRDISQHAAAKSNIIIRNRNGLFTIDIDKTGEKYRALEFKHGESSAQYSLGEESDGTVRILDLMEVLLSKESRTFVIDELDRCLHPNLTYKFVEKFLKYAERKKIQLVVTTHEARLLDFDLLRRDEIWFVNKNNNGKSDIYSLEEFNERFDKKIDKAYLDGRYGGVPIFNEVFPVEKMV